MDSSNYSIPQVLNVFGSNNSSQVKGDHHHRTLASSPLERDFENPLSTRTQTIDSNGNTTPLSYGDMFEQDNAPRFLPNSIVSLFRPGPGSDAIAAAMLPENYDSFAQATGDNIFYLWDYWMPFALTSSPWAPLDFFGAPRPPYTPSGARTAIGAVEP